MSEETNPAEVESANTPTDVGLTVQDIINVVKIIDVVSGRGAVKGEELSSVGTVRDRLVAFVNANTEQPPVDGEGEVASDEESEGAIETIEPPVE
jgi:hypothetical protein